MKKAFIKRIRLLSLLLPLVFFAFPHAAAESWSQINQAIIRPEGWRQIVQNSPFALGEPYDVTESGVTFKEMPFGTYPSIDGSTVSVPMAIELARQHLGMEEADLTGFVAFSTTHNAYLNLIGSKPNGSATVITKGAVMDAAQPVDLMIGTEPSGEELAFAQESGIELVKKPVCYDAFVFIAHVNNPTESLTVEQIRQIFSGNVSDWRDVDPQWAEKMKPPEDTDESDVESFYRIDAYQRNQNSGSQTAMENLVMKGLPLAPEGTNFYVVTEMSDLVSHIGEYNNSPTAIGYTYQYYTDVLYKDENIKVLAIDGVYPSEENLRSGAYPFTANYFGVIRKGDEAAPGGLFLDWMISEEGQRCIQQAGYTPYMALDK